MNKYQEWKAAMQGALAEAKAALEAGDATKAAEKRLEAEGYKAKMDEFTKIADLGKSIEPDEGTSRPPLPGASKSAPGFVAVKGRKVEPGDYEDDDEDEDEADDLIAKSVYVTKFGDADKATSQILRELYPTGVARAYNVQKGAFRQYLRKGDKGLNREQQASLKNVVITPQMVKEILEQGADQVGFLKATLVEAIDTLGGYAVPVDFQNKVVTRLPGFTVVRGRATVSQTSRDMVELPTLPTDDTTNHQYTSAVRVTWTEETPTSPGATNFTLGGEQIPIHTVMAETYLSRNLIEDSIFDLEGYLAEKFAEASGIDEDNRFLTGSGVGNPVGWLPGSINANSLTEVLSGDANLLTWDGLISMIYSVPSQYRNNCVWIGKRLTWSAVQKLRTATGGDYLWQPYQYSGGEMGKTTTLLGYPVLEQEIMPSVAANAFPILFGDLRGYNIFDRIGMTVERYLDSATARTNQVLYIMRRRLGGQPIETWRMSVQKVAAS